MKVAFFILACLATAPSVRGQGSFLTTTHAYLNGSCQVPANESPHVGVASFQYNPFGGTTIKCSVNFELPYIPLSAQIHGPARPGETAPVLFDLGSFSVVTNVLAVITWPPATNYWTNITVACTNTVEFTSEQRSQLDAGLLYVNVTSTNFSTGEVRGQITDRPVLSLPTTEEGVRFAFRVTGPPGNSYTIQFSTNLADWLTLTNVTVTNSMFEVVDLDATNSALRFYRAQR